MGQAYEVKVGDEWRSAIIVTRTAATVVLRCPDGSTYRRNIDSQNWREAEFPVGRQFIPPLCRNCFNWDKRAYIPGDDDLARAGSGERIAFGKCKVDGSILWGLAPRDTDCDDKHLTHKPDTEDYTERYRKGQRQWFQDDNPVVY